jgi:hypothetical protein
LGHAAQALSSLDQRIHGTAQASRCGRSELRKRRCRRITDNASQVIVQIPAQVVDQPGHIGSQCGVAGHIDRRALATERVGNASGRVGSVNRHPQVGLASDCSTWFTSRQIRAAKAAPNNF